MVSHRSTKGASKARRDQINHEIRKMRALLPFSQEDQERLSYLHSMAAICTYIRKSVLFEGLGAEDVSHSSLPYQAFVEALHGFIMVTTAQGRLVYVSENVGEYLKLSMVDVLQGDSFYDMVESSDVPIVKSNLDIENNSSSERSFICCMQTSKVFKLHHGSCCSTLVRGRFQTFSRTGPFSSAVCTGDQPLFVALCTPTVNLFRSSEALFCSRFDSVHRMDMTFTQLSDSVLYFLGYSADEMSGRSWYSLVHPEDLSSSAASHRSLVQADEGCRVEMVLRLQCKDLSWTWIYIQANKDSECLGFSCTNFIISETEARYLQKKINSNAFRPSSLLHSCDFTEQQVLQAQNYSSTNGFKRQRTSQTQSEESPGDRSRRDSNTDLYHVACASCQGDSSPVLSGGSPALFTPPYSPSSSSSPLQQEDLSHDHLMDVNTYTDQLLSSPESSPSYDSHTEVGLACHRSPSLFFPALSEQTFLDPAAFGSLRAHSPLLSSPDYDFQACQSDAHLVPDRVSVPNMCEIPADCALYHDVCFLEQPQEGSFDHEHQVPRRVLPTHSSLLTPSQSPSSTEPNHYTEREQAEISILAHQISTMASTFDMSYTLNPLQTVACDWSHHLPLSSVLPPKREIIPDPSVFDNILKDLDTATRRSSLSIPDVVSNINGEGPHLGLSPTILEYPLPAEQFSVMHGFDLQLGHHDQNPGLHQLNNYVQSGLQQVEPVTVDNHV